MQGWPEIGSDHRTHGAVRNQSRRAGAAHPSLASNCVCRVPDGRRAGPFFDMLLVNDFQAGAPYRDRREPAVHCLQRKNYPEHVEGYFCFFAFDKFCRL